jgi:chromosome segregation ATPase
MDNDIKDLLMQLMEGQTAIKTDLSEVKEDISGLKTELSGVKKDISEVKTDLVGVKVEVSGVKEELSGLKNEVRKNTISIEAMNKNIDIIAEVQTAHKEQNGRDFNNIHSLVNEKANIIENVLTGATKDIKEVNESIEVLKVMTGKHEVDINILRRRPV